MYEIFQKLLELHNVTTADVCKATGISQSVMSNWKKRRNNLSAENARVVADYFDVSIEYLLTGKESEKEYYLDKEAAEYAEFLRNNPEYKVLFDASRNVKKEDVKKALKAIGIFTDE
jgi:transcriptional regulator with XRE-family HTH domain